MRGAIVAGVISGLWILGCCLPSEEQIAAHEAKMAAQDAQDDVELRALAVALQKVDAGVKALGKSKETRCDPAAMKAAMGPKPKKSLHAGPTDWKTPLGIRASTLAGFASGEPFSGTADEAPPPWDWMDSMLFRAQKPRTATSTAGDNRILAETLRAHPRVIAVWIPEVETAPSLVSEGGLLSDATFIPGAWAGWLGFWALDTAEPVCLARVEASSSEKLTFDDHGAIQTTPEQAMNADMADQLKTAGTEARKRITDEVRLGVLIMEF